MRIYKSIILSLFGCLICYSCINDVADLNKESKTKFQIIDTLDTDKIIDDLESDMWNNLGINYLDKEGNNTEGVMKKRDTLFLKLNYKSSKFEDLAKNSTLTVNSLTDNCAIDKVDDKFRLIVNSNYLKDTIEYEILLKSPNYLFRSLNYKNNKISIHKEMRLVTILEAFSLRPEK